MVSRTPNSDKDNKNVCQPRLYWVLIWPIVRLLVRIVSSTNCLFDKLLYGQKFWHQDLLCLRFCATSYESRFRLRFDSIRAFSVDHLNYFFTTARNCVVGLNRSDVSAATSGRHDDGGKIDHGDEKSGCQTRKYSSSLKQALA